MDVYMFIFEILIFSAAVILIYLYWNTYSSIPSNLGPGGEQRMLGPGGERRILGPGGERRKEGFADLAGSGSGNSQPTQNISMCPGISKSFVGKNGDNLCCEGNAAGTECEGKVICTLSSTNSKTNPSCAAYLSELYRKKGVEFCPKNIPNYFIDAKGRAFCTASRINNQLNAPQQPTALKCSIGGKGMGDSESCEVQLALDKMPCPSPGCQKGALRSQPGKPVLLYANFNDAAGIQHICYDTASVIRRWRNIFGEEWKSKVSHINPDRNIMFCDVAKKYYIDKTIQKKDVDI